MASSEVERRLWPRKDVGKNTAAYDLLNGTTPPDRPQDVDAEEGIDRVRASLGFVLSDQRGPLRPWRVSE